MKYTGRQLADGTSWEAKAPDCTTKRIKKREFAEDTSDLFRAVWDLVPDAVALFDSEGNIHRVNRACMELYGYSRDKLVGHRFSLICSEDCREEALSQFRILFNTDDISPSIQSTVKREHGSEIIVEARLSFLLEIGSTRRTTRQMGNKETRNDYGTEILRDAQIMIVDDQEVNVRLLEGILGAAGYTRLVGTTDSRDVLSLMVTSPPDLILLDLTMPKMDGFEVMEQLSPQIPEEDYLPILVLTADISRETRRRALSMGAADYVTKPFDRVEVLLRIKNLLQIRFLHLELQCHNRLLEEKVRARTEALTRALHQVVTAQETERRRLSMEIHDGPLQSLGVGTLAVDRAIRRYERGEYEQVLCGLREIRSSFTWVIDDVRRVLADLSLEVLNNGGLAMGLREYIARFSDVTGISVNVSMSDSLHSGLPPLVEVLMYRLGQEAFSNVRKHAQASNIELSLKVEGDDLYMEIADDGRGFDVEAVLQKHRAGEQLGLRSMRERIGNAQGELSIDSTPGQGTSLKFRCPLSANAHSMAQVISGPPIY